MFTHFFLLTIEVSEMRIRKIHAGLTVEDLEYKMAYFPQAIPCICVVKGDESTAYEIHKSVSSGLYYVNDDDEAIFVKTWR